MAGNVACDSFRHRLHEVPTLSAEPFAQRPDRHGFGAGDLTVAFSARPKNETDQGQKR